MSKIHPAYRMSKGRAEALAVHLSRWVGVPPGRPWGFGRRIAGHKVVQHPDTILWGVVEYWKYKHQPDGRWYDNGFRGWP